MSKVSTRSLETTIDVYRQLHRIGVNLFVSGDIVDACPKTPQGTVTGAISQMVSGGLLEMLGKRQGLSVYRLTPWFRDHTEKNAIELAAENVNRQSRVRFDKGQ